MKVNTFRYVAAASVISISALAPLGHAASYTWRNVAIGGGGCWTTGIVASLDHKQASKNVLYVRTDCGGAYRWSKGAWVPITDWIPFEHRSDYSIESIAVNPRTGSEVYIAVGSYFPDGGRDAGTIFKSTDYGIHWKQAYFNNAPVKRFDGTSGLSMNGNGGRRWGGERLVCDPGRPGNLLFGSRVEGLWASSDDAKTWSRVASVPPGTRGYGVTAVAFDPRGNGVAYAAVEGSGVYKSTDHGATWQLITAQPAWPATVRRMYVSGDGNMWCTYGAATSENSSDPNTTGGIAEYLPDQNVYKLYDPVPGGSPYFLALAINPDNPKDIVAAATKGKTNEADSSSMWRSTDEGATWTQIDDVQNSSLPWYKTSTYTVSSFMYDPEGNFGQAGSLWYVDGVGIWRTRGPVTVGTTNFYSEERGHEEMCALNLLTPPSGPNELVVGVMDQDGFEYPANGIDQYPARHLSSNIKGPWVGITLAIACPDNPLDLVSLYGESDFGGPYFLGTSTDGGQTWQSMGYQGADGWVNVLPRHITVDGQTVDFKPINLAVNSADANNIVVLGSSTVGGKSELALIYTNQGAATKDWGVCGGYFLSEGSTSADEDSPNNMVVADPMTAGVFYAINGDAVYKSVDSGASFKEQGNPTNGQSWGIQKLAATPGMAGDLWYSAEGDKGSWQNHLSSLQAWEGLYHSTDDGATWTKIEGVTRCVTFAVGRKPKGGTTPIYYFGRCSIAGRNVDSDSVYCSMDGGTTWTCMLDDAGTLKIGNYPMMMEASRQTPGRIFIGTGGRGVFYSSLEK